MSLDSWKKASFLAGSESNVRQWEPLPGGSVRPSGPCCFAVAEAPFVSLDGWKRASLGAVARRLGPSFRALLFCCGEGSQTAPPTRKLALFQPSRLTNGALATAKQQGPEGRTEPPGNGSQTSSLPAVKAHKRRLRHSKTAGP